MTRRVLLADDSVTIRRVVELTFSDEDFRITAVGDGALALESARAERPDIVISDVFMPGLNGYELCERMKTDASLRSVPVLLLRGTFESFDEKRAAACGADGIIVKPFEAQELVRKVKELIAAAPVPAAAAEIVSVPPAPPARPIPTPPPPPPPRPATAPPPPPPPSAHPLPAPVARAAAAPLPPPLPPPARPVSLSPLAPPPFADEDFDFGPAEPAPASAAGPNDDLWSEVSLRGGTAPIIDAAAGEENFWGSLADETVLERQAAPAPAAEPVAPPVAPQLPAVAAVDPDEIRRLVADRLEAAVRQALEPLIAGIARPLLEEIAWQVVPELAEAMIRAEIERIARSTDSG
jgi:CheY-like chemotaxis protein